VSLGRALLTPLRWLRAGATAIGQTEEPPRFLDAARKRPSDDDRILGIDAQNLSKRFGEFVALDDVSLEVHAGELVALLGPSGSGKTTLLRVIAGLEFPDTGAVLLEGADATMYSVRDRRVGFVFQHYALFRHMTVFDNVAFGLRVRSRDRRPSSAEIDARVRELLGLVQLEPLARRYPSQLSGGQRQRVALARALAVQPRVLLLDEPFGALDAKVRKELRRWLRRLHDELAITSVLVTHDQEEALEVADRVVIMNRGRIEQVGTPSEIYSRPATPFVYDFLGDVNLFHCRLEGGLAYIEDTGIPFPGVSHPGAGAATVYVRPHALEIDDHRPRDAGHFRARVRRIAQAGATVKLDLQAEWGAPLHAEISRERWERLGLEPDADVFVSARDGEAFVAVDSGR
jgi:sulfate transport system ATP-binding protein